MKLSRIFASVMVGTIMMAIPATVHGYYYPVDRQTYKCITIDNCPGADHVQFNSFTNNPVVGDERPFVAGNINGQGNVQDRLQVKDGDTVLIRAYVHNNADANKMGGEQNTIAKNVKIYFLIPSGELKDSTITGAITADNASPKEVNDTMSVYASNAFTLQYVAGSAEFEHKPDGKNLVTTKVSDSLVTSQGASLGNIPGCFAYSGYVTLKVTVHMKSTPKPPTPAYSCDLLHIASENNSRKVTIDQFKTSQSNGAAFKNVVIDWDAANGVTNTTTSQNPLNLTHTYAADGTYKITATAHFMVNGSGDVTAPASASCSQTVTFSNGTTTTPPAQLPDTGAGNTIAIAFGAIVAGTIAGRLFLSRKLSRR